MSQSNKKTHHIHAKWSMQRYENWTDAPADNGGRTLCVKKLWKIMKQEVTLVLTGFGGRVKLHFGTAGFSKQSS